MNFRLRRVYVAGAVRGWSLSLRGRDGVGVEHRGGGVGVDISARGAGLESTFDPMRGSTYYIDVTPVTGKNMLF